MSVLDTLAVIFEAKNADKVKKEVDAISDGMDDASNSTAQMVKELGNFSAKLTAVIAPLAAFRSAARTAFEYGREAHDLQMMAQEAGTTTQSIQILGNALKNYGGDAASASAVIGKLNQDIQNMRLGQSSRLREAASLYKFSLTGTGPNGLATAEEMLENISTAMRGLNEVQQINFGQMIGLDAPTIALMQQKYETLAEAKMRAAKMKVFTPEEIDHARKFNTAMIKMYDSFDKMKAIIGRALLPSLEWISSKLAALTDWWDQNRESATTALYIIGGALAAFAAAGIASLAPLVAEIAAVVAPILAIGAALFLVLDDFRTFQAGGESVTGKVVQYFKDLWDEIKWIGETVRDFWSDIFDNIAGWIEKLKFWKDTDETVKAGAKAIEQTRTPLASVTSGATYNNATRNSASNASISVQNIEIVTQATDAKGISNDILKGMMDSLPKTLGQMQTGIAY